MLMMIVVIRVEKVHDRIIDEHWSDLEGVLLLDSLCELVCGLSERSDVANWKAELLHVLKRQDVS